MTRIAYVGRKDSETAFKDDTGITWAPGAVHDIAKPEVAAKMLRHPDVFALEVDARAVIASQAAGAVKQQTAVGRADGHVLVAVSIDLLAEAQAGGLVVGVTADGFPLLLAPQELPGGDIDEDAQPAAATADTKPQTVDLAAISLAPGATVAAAPAKPADPLAAIDTMDRDELHALAKSRGVEVHHAAGSARVREALRAAATQ